MTIFTITTLAKEGKAFRCWGYHSYLVAATQAVERIASGLYEAYWEWIVVEEHPVGIGRTGVARAWFRWDSVQSRWERVWNPPLWAESVTNWSMG